MKRNSKSLNSVKVLIKMPFSLGKRLTIWRAEKDKQVGSLTVFANHLWRQRCQEERGKGGNRGSGHAICACRGSGRGEGEDLGMPPVGMAMVGPWVMGAW